ncbi:Tn3 family transposase [Nonomuraea sp. NPDC049684]|uniref:Tn3 family transposase n=1 Tax=Nonomuraea sp. NPDC049684 TaxID=3364356 RepID=UPI0037AE62A3
MSSSGAHAGETAGHTGDGSPADDGLGNGGVAFVTLVADLVMYQTTLDMSLVLNQLRSEGEAVHRAEVAIMSPYQEDNVRRFGDYIYDLDAPLEGMEVHLDIEEEVTA